MMLSSKYFVMIFILFVGSVLLFLLSTHYIARHYFDFTDASLIRYQNKKLATAHDITTIIVGDSSAGNTMDAAFFEKLSGQKTLSIALGGSNGFERNFNMIRRALQTQPIKNVVMIYALRLWNRKFDRQAYFESLGNLPDPYPRPSLFPSKLSEEYIRFLINLREAKHFFSFLKEQPRVRNFDKRIDYMSQNEDAFSNGRKKLTEDDIIPDVINEERKKLFSITDEFCARNNLRCIYAHGPLLEEVADNFVTQTDAINSFMQQNAQYIIPIKKIFSYPRKKMGDAIEHVDPLFKKEVTKEYFETIKQFLK